MKVNSALRMIAGLMIMVSILLQTYHDPRWIFFTGFIALNLFQSAFTNWCPMMVLLRKLGFKD
jgi:hypothetical protein